MSTSTSKLVGRAAVAVLLVLLAAGTVLAAAATRPATPPPALAEPSASASPATPASPKPDTSPKPEKSAKPTTAPAVEQAEDDDAGAGPSAANLARIVERLAAVGITTTADDLAALAAKVGVGGAVRVLWLAKQSGQAPSELLAKFESGTGWGVIAKDLGLHPGLGSVMGNGKGLDKEAKAAEKAARAQERAERKAGASD
jgi:hypothetical protein